MGCAPLLLCGFGHIALLMDFRYPRFDLSMLGSYVPLLLVSNAPAILWLIGWFTRFWYGARRGLKWVLAVICVLWLPVTWIATFFTGWASPIYTETTNPAHYLQLRQYETARDDLIYAFFPVQPRTVQYVKPDRVYEVQPVEVRYHYRKSENVERRCEIYAEWTLPVEELAAERDRVAALFASRNWWDTQTVQQGAFTCLMHYAGPAPFSEKTSYYTQLIFAWDEATGRVRYIYALDDSGQMWRDEPLYRSLDW